MGFNMAAGVLNIDLGFALGKKEVKYSLGHTGKGYVSLIASMPFLGKVGDPTCQEVQIKATKENFNLLERVRFGLEMYEKLLRIKEQTGLFIPDNPTIDLQKLRINKAFQLSVFTSFFNAKAGVKIDEAKKLLDEITTALSVEDLRSCSAVKNMIPPHL